MIHYYINPKSKQLIVIEFDDKAMEVTPLERIEAVGEVEESQLPLKPAPAYVPRQRKQRLCGVCEKPGHTLERVRRIERVTTAITTTQMRTTMTT